MSSLDLWRSVHSQFWEIPKLNFFKYFFAYVISFGLLCSSNPPYNKSMPKVIAEASAWNPEEPHGANISLINSCPAQSSPTKPQVELLAKPSLDQLNYSWPRDLCKDTFVEETREQNQEKEKVYL